MYQQYWGLRESPFRGGLDLAQFYPTPNHDEALARLNFLVEERRRLAVLSGPTGIGKSTLFELFARQIRDTGAEVVSTCLIGMDRREFLWALAAGWGLNPAVAATPFELWRRLADRVVECRYQRTGLLVLLDDAEAADPAVADLMLRLTQLDPHAESRLTIVLAANQAHLNRLPARLLELAELAIHLDPWSVAETRGFLAQALQKVGGQPALFTPAAVVRLHELTGGIPLAIKQLADLTLVAGAGLELAKIDADTVDGAFQELGIVVPNRRPKSATH